MKPRRRWDLFVTITIDGEVIHKEYIDISSADVLFIKAQEECAVPSAAEIEFVKMRHRYKWEER